MCRLSQARRDHGAVDEPTETVNKDSWENLRCIPIPNPKLPQKLADRCLPSLADVRRPFFVSAIICARVGRIPSPRGCGSEFMRARESHFADEIATQ